MEHWTFCLLPSVYSVTMHLAQHLITCSRRDVRWNVNLPGPVPSKNKEHRKNSNIILVNTRRR